MREISLTTTNYVLFVLLTVILSAAQSSLWLHVFGYTPAPYLWLIVPTYWSLNRSPTEAVLMHYLTVYILVTMSGVPLIMAFFLAIAIFGLIFALKDRVLWSGVNSFMLASTIAAGSLPLFTLVWSFALEARSITDFHFFAWVLSSLLTAIAAIPLYYLFNFVDRLTHKSTTQTEPNYS